MRSMKTAMASTLVADGSLLVLGILTGSLAARLLLPEGRGALAVSLFWPQLLAGLGLLSLHEAATYRIGVDSDRGPMITASSLVLALCLSAVTMSVGYMILPILLGEERSHLVHLARVYLLVFVPFNFVALILLAADHGRLCFVRYNAMRLSVSAIYLLGLVLMWAMGRTSVAWVLAANGAGTVLVALTQIILQRRRIAGGPSVTEVRTLLAFSARFHPASVLSFFAVQADQLIVLTMWDDAVLGVYVVALTVASSGLAVVGGAFHRVLFPHLAHVQEAGERAKLLARGVRHATVLLVGLSIPLMFFLPWLVPLLFGTAFRESIPPAYVLLVAYPMAALKTILIQGIRGLGEGHPGSVASAVCLTVLFVLAFPLGRTIGLIGVGVALGLANLAAVAYLTFHLWRHHGVSPVELWSFDCGTLGEVWTVVGRLNPFVVHTSR